MQTGLPDPYDDLRDQVALLTAEVSLLRERLADRREALVAVADGIAELRVRLDEHIELLAEARRLLRPGDGWERREFGL